LLQFATVRIAPFLSVAFDILGAVSSPAIHLSSSLAFARSVAGFAFIIVEQNIICSTFGFFTASCEWASGETTIETMSDNKLKYLNILIFLSPVQVMFRTVLYWTGAVSLH
jgi:hypothetical protein